MTPRRWHGVFAIPPAPFTEDGAVDWAALRRTVRFAVGTGAHGLAGPVIASEFQTLSDDERKAFVRVMVEEVAGRVPVVAGVSGGSGEHAASLAAAAREAGADGVIAMAPPQLAGDQTLAVRYYTAVAEAAGGLPVVLQNAPLPLGAGLGLAAVLAVLGAVPAVRYLKEETPPIAHRVSAAVAAAGQRLDGVFGGLGGLHFLEELERGACGTMVACGLADVLVALYERYRAGDQGGAWQIYATLLPGLVRELGLGVAWWKGVLLRRGVLASARSRTVAVELDQHDLAALDRLLAELRPYLRA